MWQERDSGIAPAATYSNTKRGDEGKGHEVEAPRRWSQHKLGLLVVLGRKRVGKLGDAHDGQVPGRRLLGEGIELR